MYDDYDLDYIMPTDYNLDETTHYVLDEDMWYEHNAHRDSYTHLDSHEEDEHRDQQDYMDLAYRHYA